MKITQTFVAVDRKSWHDWLEEHGSNEKEVWLVYYKAASGKPTISYQESLEEALCFGWVDSLIQKIDEESYARKFNPRRAGSNWSELNKHLVARLIQEGRMTPAGLAKVDFDPAEASVSRPRRAPLPLPDWLKEALMAYPAAWENFQKLAPSHQRNYIGWISEAKRDETRQKRIKLAVERLEQGLPLGLL